MIQKCTSVLKEASMHGFRPNDFAKDTYATESHVVKKKKKMAITERSLNKKEIHDSPLYLSDASNRGSLKCHDNVG